MKTLFICKKNENYGYSTTGKRSGLYNSTRFVADALGAEVIEVTDNNAIDREVKARKPEAVVIEALWVVPEKFDVLKRLHPGVKWYVHIHSNIPFLAYEGIAVAWLKGYAARGVSIIVNSPQALAALSVFVPAIYLPNVYPVSGFVPMRKKSGQSLNVGCFGAVRPMKNQLTQAIAAVKFAKARGLHLSFFINSNRSETGGDPVLRNLRALFAGSDATLVEMPWLEHPEFLALLKAHIDIALQVSLSETFNIVTADAVACGVPVVTSDEISWVGRRCQARTDDVTDIADRMGSVLGSSWTVSRNQQKLKASSEKAVKAWKAALF